jgi:hypothetical protein
METVIDKGLERVWDGGEEVRIQELTGVIWVWNIFCNTAQSSVVIHATGPNLRRLVSTE